MSESLSERRMVENEVVFRRHNENVQQGFDKIKKLAQETSQDFLEPDDDTPLYFYCECSDENCRQRILMKPSEHAKIHKDRYQFVLIPGHETTVIEQVIERTDDYNIVEKFNKPPESVGSLQPTDVDNS
jgi:hypothetical protein